MTREPRTQPATEYRTCVCSHDCPDSCAVRVGVRSGDIVSIGGDPAHPFTRGFLCGKVNRYAERVYHPGRILTPLRRVGAKGEGRFEPIGWDDALDEIARRFQTIADTHGPEAILPYSYGGTIGQLGFNAGHPFFHALGASRLARTVCVAAAQAGLRITLGHGIATDIEEAAQARQIVVWGLNAVATHVHFMPLVKAARRHGARLVVIDTYRNATARQADWFVQVRPGTDAALALGMMRVMLAEGLYDPAFVEAYTHGLEALREACAPWTPAETERVTGVAATEVEALGRAYGSEPRTFLRLGLGLSRHSNGGMTVRTIACLPAITGAWEAEGGGFLCYAWTGLALDAGVLTQPGPHDPPARTVNMVRLGEALTTLDDPPVKALYVYNSNPAAIAPEQATVHAGLRREDLFCVVHEQMPTDTVAYADIVLPATTFMEHHDLLASYGHGYVQFSRPAIAPRGEAKSNLDTFRLLAARMGLDCPAYRLGDEELAVAMAAGRGGAEDALDTGRLLAGEPLRVPRPTAPWREGLRTPSRRFEFISERVAAQGLPAAPAWVPSAEGHIDNDLRARFPLQLVTPPSQHFLNSTFADTPTSRKLEVRPRLKLHPADAAARGLADGDACRAFNERGACRLTVEVTEDVRPGVAVAESIWWPGAHPGGLGINALTSAELTDLGGGARFHDGLVQVEPAPATDATG